MTTHQMVLPETVADLPKLAASRLADRPAHRFYRDGRWQDTTYADVLDIARGIGLGLIDLGVAAGDRVAVLADTRPEWLHAEFGIAMAGAIVVPIYPSSSADECEWVLADSGSVVVICENAGQLGKIEKIRDRLPALRHIVLIDRAGSDGTTLAELGARDGDAAELQRRTTAVRADDPALIIYTSGTTGRPKGCVLTHRNLTTCCRVTDDLDLIGPNDALYLFLPMAHAFAQVVTLAVASAGGVVVFCSSGASAIMADLQATSPTVLPSVPRIFEKVYATLSGMVPAQVRAQAVATALAVRRMEQAGEPVPDELRQGFERANALLFSKVRAAFGGAVRLAISGAAPISPEILEFFHAAGVPVFEGYGLSESTAMGTFNTPDAWRIGTIGPPEPGFEVRIAADGEILIRGPHIFAGYWHNPDATAEVIVDGWLQTGDLGGIDDDGFVTITGRKKDIIITAGGKNLTPNNVENDLRGSRWISQAVMHGDRRPYPVALITLDAEEVVPWAAANGLPADIPALAAHPAVLSLIQQVVDEVNVKYARVEQIKKFAILDHDLSVESGELTPTLKVKRRVINEKYADLFDRLYAAGA
jgi:long-chain acyl-CoA synthetase